MKIKIVSKNGIRIDQFDLPRQFPHHDFIFDPNANDYDWFVVYDDLPPKDNERLPLNSEPLSCPPQNTLLLTYEPSSVKFYGRDYMDQFAHVLTSHEPEFLRHKNRHDGPPVGVWFYGNVKDAIAHPNPPDKTELISTFLSAKTMKHTLHKARFDFLQAMKEGLDELTCFGRGYHFVETKNEGIDPFAYHIAAENHIGPHHWTEKLSDAFLGYALPFYAGCTNLDDYFPADSYIPIDLRRPKEAIQIIQSAIEAGEYEKRLPAIIEARQLVLEDYNLPNVIGRVIEQSSKDKPNIKGGPSVIHSRHQLMKKNPVAGVLYGVQKHLGRRKNKKKWASYLHSA